MTPQIIVADGAIKEIKYLLELKELGDSFGVRVGVRGGGCSGFTYHLEFGRKSQGDIEMEKEGVKFFTDPKSLLYLNGTTLTYTDGLQGKGFSFENPNAAQTCGCGESFAV